MSADIAGGGHQSPEPPKGAEGWGRRLAEVVVLAILAVLLNLGAPTFFLDTQVMLGGSLAVYALLRFGWIGLVVGLASLAVTWFRWGHPIGLMVGMLFFLCLAVYLGTGDGGARARRENGNIVLVAFAFWLVGGAVFETLLFHRWFDLPLGRALGLGLKEAVTGALQATLGFTLYMGGRYWGRRSGAPAPSLRGLVFALVLVLLAVPGFSVALFLSHQIRDVMIGGQLERMEGVARLAGGTRLPEGQEREFLRDIGRDWDVELSVVEPSGRRFATDRALFAELGDREAEEGITEARGGTLGISRPPASTPVLRENRQSFLVFRHRVAAGPGNPGGTLVVVAEPFFRLLDRNDLRLSVPLFGSLLGLLGVGALVGARIGAVVAGGVGRWTRTVERDVGKDAVDPIRADERVAEFQQLGEAVGLLQLSLRRAVEEEKKAKEEMTLILNHLPIGVSVYSLEPGEEIKFLNDEFLRMLGYAREDLPDLATWWRLAYPEEAYREHVRVQWEEKIERARQSLGSVESAEFKVTAKDGRELEVLFRAVVAGRRIFVAQTDISELRRTQRALSSARRELERVAYELTENIPVGTYTMVQPASGGMAFFSFMSTRFLELTGLEREEAASDPMKGFACVHPDDFDEWVRKNQYVFEHRMPFCEECRVVVKGEVRWIIAESVPRELPDGSVVWEGVLQDITARKLAEEKLAESESRYRSFFHMPLVGTAILTAGEDWFAFNEQTLQILGRTREELPSVPWPQIVHPEDRPRDREQTEKMRRGESEGSTEEVRIQRGDGRIAYVLVSKGYGPSDSTGAVHFYVNLLDITERHRFQEELNQKLRSSLDAAAMAHEISQPLSRILMRAHLDLDNAGERDRGPLLSLIEDAEDVVAGIERMKMLLRNVKTVHERVILLDVVRSSFHQVRKQLRNTGVEISLEGGENREATVVSGDAVQLQMVLTNLLKNAIDAIAMKGGETRRIAIRIEGRAATVRVTVADSGVGWPGGKLEDFLLKSSKPKGSGIGLYIVQTALGHHGATIEVGESEWGGAEFTLCFPCRPVDAIPLLATEAPRTL